VSASRGTPDGADTSADAAENEVAAAARRLGIALTRSERAEVARLVGRARAPEGLFERLKAARSVHREHPFAFVLGARETLITGAIDVLALEHSGSALIVDYKTDRVDDDCDIGELVARASSLQRLIYALAVLRAYAHAVEISHWFRARQVREVCRAARCRTSGAPRRAGRAGAHGGFIADGSRPQGVCGTCPTRWVCRGTTRRPCVRGRRRAGEQAGSDARDEDVRVTSGRAAGFRGAARCYASHPPQVPA
jgi:hypothetical protein